MNVSKPLSVVLSVVPSNRQVDALGDRLRASGGPAHLAPDELGPDLMILEAFRQSFQSSYQTVMNIVASDFGASPSGRPFKSTGAIAAKLRRQPTRLSQMQDVAGCRVLVADRADQDRLVEDLQTRFLPLGKVVVDDRRGQPSYGYRAVHVIVHAHRAVEIQVRTHWQHWWAEFSEAMAVVFGDEVKYGGSIVGAPDLRAQLDELSDSIAGTEAAGGSPELEPTSSQGWFPLLVVFVASFLLVLTRSQAQTEVEPLQITNKDGPIFLIRYDRGAKRLLTINGYRQDRIDEARTDKLAAEIRDPGLEIVLLEATSLAALQATHSRYFGVHALERLEPIVRPTNN